MRTAREIRSRNGKPFGRKAGRWEGAFETLEQRVLLSGEAVPSGGMELKSWLGAEVEVVPDSWLVTYSSELGVDGAYSRTMDMLQTVGAVAKSINVLGGGQFVQFISSSPISESVVAWAKSQVDGLLGVEPDLIHKTAAIPNDPLFTQQWGLENVGQFVVDPGGWFIGNGKIGSDISAVDAWDTTIGSSDVIVAVVDTGVDWTHPDLAANIWRNTAEIAGNGLDDDGNGFADDIRGWDFGEQDNDPMDEAGHGTACAGCIGAVGNNGIGVSGVAWNVRILPMKIADQFGGLSTSAIVGAHEYLTMMRGRGWNIVASSNSYGAFAPTFYKDLEDGLLGEKLSIQKFVDSGGTFVVAAGNEANDNDKVFTSFPASYDIPAIISVAATDPNDGLAGFSSWGAESVDLGAPGVGFMTTRIGGGYAGFNGTSCATPIVAGAVALLKTYNPSASAIEIKQALLNGVDPIAALQGKAVSGGRLNIAESLRIIGLSGPVVKVIDPGPVDILPKSAITVTFSEALDPAFISNGAVSLIASGGDGTFGEPNDSVKPIATVSLSGDGLVVTITPIAPLGVDTYRLTLDPAGFRDNVGNYMNGDSNSGFSEVYDFRLAGVGTDFENNDTLLSATPVVFDASSQAKFSGVTIGDGLFAALDVDIFRIEMQRGGLITAKVDAKSLPTPSPLDTYVRLFDAAGNELASNDQFNASDSFVDFFVTTGGTYYVGVSGFPNSNYDPETGGSGTSQSKGTYNLTINVALVDDDDRTYADAQPGTLAIPDQGFVTDKIYVPDSRLILDVDVSVNVSHDFVGDLKISLINPGGKEIVLMASRGGDGNFQINDASPIPALFDDEAGQSITLALPPYSGGAYRPEEALSGFDATGGLGFWTIKVEDQDAFNTGTLNGWSLRFIFQNNIFGPFELNDTLTTARDLSINGTGSAQRQAAIGDGGFGNRDVDIYRFTADAGSSFNASVISGGALNAALRLFDGTGTELKLSDPAGINSSTIVNFVFVTGGVYFIGVSESVTAAGDGAYDPLVGGSGDGALTTGAYTLNVELTSGVSDGSLFLSGQQIGLGVGSTGAFDNGSTGLTYFGNEMIRGDLFNEPTTSYFGAVAGGSSFRNDGPGGDIDLPLAITSQSDSFNRRVVAQGEFRGLKVERSVSFGVGDSFMVFDVSLTNITGTAMNGVAWMEALNPQPGLNLSPFTASTKNDVLNGSPFASASYYNNDFLQGLTLALAAPQSDTRADATVLSPFTVIRDPQQILDAGVIDPEGAVADAVLALSFNIGILQAGDTTTMRYFLFLSDNPGSIAQQYATLNAGTGSGNLTVDGAAPANDADGLPILPYTLYYPEGYANARASTFVPVVNPNDTDSRVVIIARYETGDRDQVLFDDVMAAHTRGGITITTPEMYAANTLLVRKDTPYAIEIRSQTPVAATMSHYDFGASIGEAFTSLATTTWSFSQVSKGEGSSDFVVFYNTTDSTVKVTTTLYRDGGGVPIVLNATVGAHRRGGWNIGAESNIPDGTYGVVISSSRPIVASVSSYNAELHNGFGALATPGIGSTGGAIPQGQFGLNTATETISILNANSTEATVTFTFSFDNGSSYRTQTTVGARSRGSIEVNKLANFQAGRAYAVSYESDISVSIATPTLAAGEPEGALFSAKAWSYWGFAEGFRPAGQSDQVSEYLRLYNAESDDIVVDIKVDFADGGSEIFRRIAGAGRVTEIDVHTLITGDRRLTDQFYGLTVKSSSPIVVFLGRTDAFFPGAFGSMGTPLGVDEFLG